MPTSAGNLPGPGSYDNGNTISNRVCITPTNLSVEGTSTKPSNMFGGKTERAVCQFNAKDGPGPGY